MFCFFSTKFEKENLIFNADYVSYITYLDLDDILRTRLAMRKTIYPQKKKKKRKFIGITTLKRAKYRNANDHHNILKLLP